MNTFEMTESTKSKGDLTYAVTTFHVSDNDNRTNYNIVLDESDPLYDPRQVTEVRRKLLSAGYEEVESE